WCRRGFAPPPTRERRESANAADQRRERDELVVVALDGGEASVLPVEPRLLDALARARDEVPPDVALTVEGSAAEQHDAAGLQRLYARGRAPAEHDQGTLAVALAAGADAALGDVRRPLGVLLGKV